MNTFTDLSHLSLVRGRSTDRNHHLVFIPATFFFDSSDNASSGDRCKPRGMIVGL